VSPSESTTAALTPSTLAWLFGEQHVKPPSRLKWATQLTSMVQGGETSALPSTTLPSGAKGDGEAMAGIMVNRAAWNLSEQGLLRFGLKTPSQGENAPPGLGGGEVRFEVTGQSDAQTVEGELLRHLAKTKPRGDVSKAFEKLGEAASKIPTGVDDLAFLAPSEERPEEDPWDLQERLEQGRHWRDWIKLARREAEAAGCVEMKGVPPRRSPRIERSRLPALQQAWADMDERYQQFRKSEPQLAAAIFDACAVGVAGASAQREMHRSGS
jgi:hypothetical protein